MTITFVCWCLIHSTQFFLFSSYDHL
uniref:Uncharacterized protein n=1 Tax=Rhizophora mucronata TaxID=61149 RepID=A0A2P2M6V1_RHIMU